MIVPANTPSLEELCAICREGGLTHEQYLADHYVRYVATKSEFLSTWERKGGDRLLDIGAHWLHQGVLYALDGFKVTAVDLPATFELASVRNLAERHGIDLVINRDLADPEGLRSLPANSADVILFTEIIEHITFNPVALWREIHRIAAPGARIVVTTPNYYALRECLARPLRALRRMGAGVSVEQILHQPTHAHHWKEYSRAELHRYFELLSPDFVISKSKYTHWQPMVTSLRRSFAGAAYSVLPIFKPNLHLEVDLPTKAVGIQIDLRW